MGKLRYAASGDEIIDAMMALARCSRWHQIIVAGANGPHRMFELHHRGYARVATTETCGLPRGQYDVALVEWQVHSIKALSATLDWLVNFISPNGVLVIWIDDREHPDRRKLAALLQKLGFRIEAGTRSGHGLAVSARRLDAQQQVLAA